MRAPFVFKGVCVVSAYSLTNAIVILAMLELIAAYNVNAMVTPIVKDPTNWISAYNVLITQWELNVRNVNRCLWVILLTGVSVYHAQTIVTGTVLSV